MSHFNDKYGDFFDNYSPDKQKNTTGQPLVRSTKKSRKKRRARRSGIIIFIAVILLAVMIAVGIATCGKDNVPAVDHIFNGDSDTVSHSVSEKPAFPKPMATEKTVTLGGEIDSKHAILIDLSDNTVLARKNSAVKIYPASMTKVMTLLVAAEKVDSISNTFHMTSTLIDPLYLNGATLAGFCPGEDVTINDMFYGMVLNSGAEAAVGLAVYIAGSEEAFVQMMNEKAAELGLTSTHFCNVSGLHDSEHYTTCEEMAIILEAAMKNDYCRMLLTTEYYTVKANDYHEEIVFHSTMMSRVNGTEPGVATILGGKTGYTSNSGNCLASFGMTDDGREIVCITAEGGGKYIPIYDSITLYKSYTHPQK